MDKQTGPEITIVMAAYNGLPYIQAQLDSILAQTYGNWRLVIREDGSTDATADVLAAYARRDDRITVLPSDGNLGANGNFIRLMSEVRTGSAYLAFADHDDIWLPHKLELCLKYMRSCEQRLGRQTPILVHTDFATIDGEGRRLSDSYAQQAHLLLGGGEQAEFFHLLAQPYAFGCASLLNAALLQAAWPFPKDIEMYDCYLALTAALVGRVEYVAQPTLEHRLHSGNQTGKLGSDSWGQRFHRVFGDWQAQVGNTALRLHQCRLLAERFGDQDTPRVTAARDFVRALDKSPRAAIRFAKRHEFRRQGLLQTLLLYATMRTGAVRQEAQFGKTP